MSIKSIFSEVHTTYERINHIITLGLDILWRKRACEIAASGGGGVWVDLCTGTGEMAFNLCRLAEDDTKIYGVDFSEEMLNLAKSKKGSDRINFVLSDVTKLPFDNESVDLITMAFATRNINQREGSLNAAFSEFYRILKRGGRFVNLETSNPQNYFVRKLFHIYVKLFVERIGNKISQTREGYSYLANSILHFHGAQVLASILQGAGFSSVSFKSLSLGAVAIHIAQK